MQNFDVAQTDGKKIFLWIASILLLFFSVEALIFRTNWYTQILDPDSTAGSFETHLYWLDKFRPKETPEVLVIGDSRIAEGFSPPQAGELTGGKVRFWNMGIAGSTPRIWYYLLRDADPTHRRFREIVFALDYYREIDSYDSPPARMIDLNYVVNRIGIADIWDFASSFKSPEEKRAAFIGTLFRGNTLRNDFMNFLRAPRDRVQRSRFSRDEGLRHNDQYKGTDRSLTGLSRDSNGQLHFPPTATQRDIEATQNSFKTDVPSQVGETSAYRMRWLGKIVDLYRGSNTKLVFLELPRGPLPTTLLPDAPTKFIDWARQQPNVTVLDPQTFRSLEMPETYFDGIHLNRKGRGLFTARLVESLPQ